MSKRVQAPDEAEVYLKEFQAALAEFNSSETLQTIRKIAESIRTGKEAIEVWRAAYCRLFPCLSEAMWPTFDALSEVIAQCWDCPERAAELLKAMEAACAVTREASRPIYLGNNSRKGRPSLNTFAQFGSGVQFLGLLRFAVVRRTKELLAISEAPATPSAN